MRTARHLTQPSPSESRSSTSRSASGGFDARLTSAPVRERFSSEPCSGPGPSPPCACSTAKPRTGTRNANRRSSLIATSESEDNEKSVASVRQNCVEMATFPILGFVVLRKLCFIGEELLGVEFSTAVFHADVVNLVKHLVEHDPR